MKNKILATLKLAVRFFCVISLSTVGISMVACTNNNAKCNSDSKNERHYEEYKLDEAYSNGYINKEDVCNISYFLYGHVNEIKKDSHEVQKLEFSPTIESPNQNTEISDDIKKSYFINHKKEFEDNGASIANIHVTKYLGQYHDCHVLQIYIDFLASPAYAVPYAVGDIQFISGGTGETVLLFREVNNE